MIIFHSELCKERCVIVKWSRIHENEYFEVFSNGDLDTFLNLHNHDNCVRLK